MVAEVKPLTLFHDPVTELDYAGDIGETTPVSWQPRHSLTFDEWLAVGNTFAQISSSINWWVGDWLNYGEKRYGETYAQGMNLTHWTLERLANVKSVTRSVKSSLRNEFLSWSHHVEIAPLEPDEQAAWLNRASVEGWSVRRLREEIKGPQLPMVTPTFADPDDVPFNHRPRTDVPDEERTAVDEYEQQADELTEDADAYTWSEEDETGEDQVQVQYLETSEQLFVNGASKPHVANNSGNNEWYTPVDLIEAARLTLGGIDLDPASSDEANKVVRAATYYTINDDGLVQEWQGRTWMNPPYATDLVGRFIERMIEHYRSGAVPEAVVLVNNATETQWFQRLAAYSSAICFPGKRIRFWSINGGSGSPLQGQAILYLGPDANNFIENFSFFGLLVRIETAMEPDPALLGA